MLDSEFNEQFNNSVIASNPQNSRQKNHYIKNKNTLLFFIIYLDLEMGDLFLRLLTASLWSTVLVLNPKNQIEKFPNLPNKYLTAHDSLEMGSLAFSKHIEVLKWKRLGLFILKD